MKQVTSFNEDGSTTQYLCSEDEHGNLWVKDCPNNVGKGMLGCCFVPKNGSTREARETSIFFVTGEGEKFVIAANPNAVIASKLLAIQARVLWDSEFAVKVEDVLSASELLNCAITPAEKESQ